jgi:hypothetical protein
VTKYDLSDLETQFNREKVKKGDVQELNHLILRIMAFYSRINKEELIATLCTMDVEY